MSIATSLKSSRPARRRLVRVSWLALLATIAAGSLGAEPYRPAPRFEGKTIPDPPNQGQPWTAPATKLPKFLVDATGILFEQGVADPRGCEYRQVEIGNGSIVQGRGFVLPQQANAPGRFVVGWDGLIYPALVVGEPADLDRDIKELAAHIARARAAEQTKPHSEGVSWGFPRQAQSFYGVSGVGDHSPIKLCLLLRLGRGDLAETLFAAGTTWTPQLRGRDLTDYRMSYLSLAGDWVNSAFGRLINAHIRGDDVLALDTARKLARFRDLATARADALGFPRGERPEGEGTGPAPRFYVLNQLDDLLRDHERRVKTSPRGPIPKKGGDPSARVAALIRDLDQIDEQQMSSPGSAQPGSSPLVRDLIAEGDPAVAPLLEVLESDVRLTRSVTDARGGSIARFVHPVHEPAFAALIGILKTREFENQRPYPWKPLDPAARKALAGAIRRFWEKTRSVPLVERWYRTLLDDSAGSARWLEAAGWIARPDVEEGMPFPEPGTRPLMGESLRVGRHPSVTALMLRRARQIDRMGDSPTSRDRGFVGACSMGFMLVSWDEKSSLPLLKYLSQECYARSDRDLVTSLARLTQIRARLGDANALDEYAAWLRTTSPMMFESGLLEAFHPLLTHLDRPAMASAARWLFNDPKSPWVPLLPGARGDEPPTYQNIFISPLIIVDGFRDGVLAGLADKTPLGTVERTDRGYTRRKIKDLPDLNGGAVQLDLEGIAVGVAYPVRVCDDVASKLSGLDGCPRCDLFWPEARRDEAVAACIAFLKRYGGRFALEVPPGPHNFTAANARLRFPILGRPATLADVASARAIFSLEGQGETRLASMPGYPQKARWVTLKDRPMDRTYPDGVTRREYDTDGDVWQAEDVRKGDGWECSYGFVGHHVVARVPASEIEFASQSHLWRNLQGGLDARTERVESRPNGYEPGQPILVATHIRNRLGVARSSPNEFIRLATDGKPALRKGVKLSLWHPSSQGLRSSMNRVAPSDAIEPKRDAHFDPGEGSRTLAPLEAFEAMRLDLNDWFDLTKPGTYRLLVTFAADSGIGEGSASEVLFQVGGDE